MGNFIFSKYSPRTKLQPSTVTIHGRLNIFHIRPYPGPLTLGCEFGSGKSSVSPITLGGGYRLTGTAQKMTKHLEIIIGRIQKIQQLRYNCSEWNSAFNSTICVAIIFDQTVPYRRLITHLKKSDLRSCAR